MVFSASHTLYESCCRFVFRPVMDMMQNAAPKSLFFITGFYVGSAVFKEPVQNLRDKFTLLVFQIQFFQVCAFIPFIIHFIHYGNAIR